MRRPVTITPSASGVTESDLAPFFAGWSTPPSPTRRVEILHSATNAVTAWSDASELVGFATAISDGIFAASIPLVEVHPAWQRHGIGTQLVRSILDQLTDCYMVDLSCDDHVVAFYERLGATRLNAMAWRAPRPTRRA